MKNKQVGIKKVENGYIVSVEDDVGLKERYSQAFRKLLEVTGAVESWQEDKLKEIEEAFTNTLGPHLSSSKTYIFKTLEEAVSFLYTYFEEINPPSKI